jgi:hypothetical protein
MRKSALGEIPPEADLYHAYLQCTYIFVHESVPIGTLSRLQGTDQIRKLFITQALDGIELRGAGRGDGAEDDSDY